MTARRILLVLALVLGFAEPARATLVLAADAVRVRGFIQVAITATADIKTVLFGERVGGADVPIAWLEIPYLRDDPVHGPLTGTVLDRVVRWRCDRLQRDLQVAGRRPDGTYEGSFFSVRTPSCRNRMILSVPRRTPSGRAVPVTVRDSWGTGLTSARVCLARRCRDVGFGQDQAVRRVRIGAPGRGLHRVVMRAPSQRIAAVAGVGVRAPKASAGGPTVLTTGDSMMQSVDTILQDRLAGRARVVSDVHLGAALSQVVTVDVPALARRQVAAHRPHVTVVFLGTNDFYAMDTRSGRRVECCDAAWIDEYVRRARRVMRIYAQGGAGRVLWYAVPAARDARRVPSNRAVSAALRRAAAGLSTVTVLPTDELFTPGMRYRETMEHRGRTVTVRQTDGLHLSIPGARIAAALVLDRLRAAGFR